MAKSLAMIGLLTKLSTSPFLLKAVLEKKGKINVGGGGDDSDVEDTGDSVENAVRLLPDNAKPEHVKLSGKSII